MQTARSTSVRRSAEAHEGIAQGYTRLGALLTAVLPYARAAVELAYQILHCNYRTRYHAHYLTYAHRLRTALGPLRARPTHQHSTDSAAQSDDVISSCGQLRNDNYRSQTCRRFRTQRRSPYARERIASLPSSVMLTM
jgi:hypothetical protein